MLGKFLCTLGRNGGKGCPDLLNMAGNGRKGLLKAIVNGSGILLADVYNIGGGGFKQSLPKIEKGGGGNGAYRLLVTHYAEGLAVAHFFEGFCYGVSPLFVYKASYFLDNQPLFNLKILF